MHSICLLLVICLATSWLPYSQAIRVDWGTNTGPIAPPPPRTTPTPPRQPYREPAPVWEDQSDDVPNPKPFVYVLPPPSRPRTWIIPAGPYAPPNYNNLPPKRNFGQLSPTYNTAGAGAGTGTVSVPALAAQYVPGVGIKYTAIVPNKLQGKYNAKTKKYKAYEKANKYAPWNYLQLLPLEEAEEEEALDRHKTRTELPNEPLLGSSTTASPSSSSSSPTVKSTATTQTTTTTTTTTAATVANYKLAHEKSAYLKKHDKLKKLLEKMQTQNNNHNNNASHVVANSS
ncbi:uncharacterized protein LOC6558715 [Drosophila grimshawi]|uniref:GH16438 n=1 Tax=Drosophila grimshawi TaxID=7222 RepID=B4IZX4_DROGR|nr:uncharacterized protein LOC6558715 [Drosophila grimshawi]EDV96746.1 GH16438 [Drosophila grimshawi]